jgi:hypothetical protein
LREGDTYLQSGKVNNAVDVGVSFEDLVKGRLVGDVDLSELGLLARDQGNALQSLWGGIVEVIGNDDLVASLEQSEGGEGADVASSTARDV